MEEINRSVEALFDPRLKLPTKNLPAPTATSSDRLNNQQCGNPRQIVLRRFSYVGLQAFGCRKEYLRWAVQDSNSAILDGNGSRLNTATCHKLGLKATILCNTNSRAYASAYEIRTHMMLFGDESIPRKNILNRQVGVLSNTADKPSSVFITHFGPADEDTYVEYRDNQQGRLHVAPDGSLITVRARATINGLPVIFSANRQAAPPPQFQPSEIHTTPIVQYFDEQDPVPQPISQLSSAMISLPGPLSPDLAKDGGKIMMVFFDLETTGLGANAAVAAIAAAAYSIDPAGTHECQSAGAGNFNSHPRPNFAPSDFARQDIVILPVHQADVCTNVICWIRRHGGEAAGVCCDSSGELPLLCQARRGLRVHPSRHEYEWP